MKRTLYVISEGRTEVNFVKQVLTIHLLAFDWVVIPITLRTGSNKAGVRKGGWRRSRGYEHAIAEIHRVLKTHRNVMYTTFFDLYGFPSDIPCYEEAKSLSSPQEKALRYERQLKEDIADLFSDGSGFRDEMFIPYIQPYEFECFLFIDPKISATVLSVGDAGKAENIEDSIAGVSHSFETPEHINNSQDTAPSKRLAKFVPGFDKNKAGKSGLSWRVAEEIGIERIRKECPHFSEWLLSLERMPINEQIESCPGG